MGSGGGSGLGTGWRQRQGYKDSALRTIAALPASSMIGCRVCLFVCFVKPKATWWNVSLLSNEPATPCPFLETFSVSFWCYSQGIFYTFTNTDIFSPCLHMKEHSMHTVLYDVVLFFFHLNQFWKLFYTIASYFWMATQSSGLWINVTS